MSCLFCKILNKEIPAKIVYEDDIAIAFDDINPQAPFHKIIIPKTHIATINDIGENQAHIAGHLFIVAKKLAKELNISEAGFRTVMNCNEQAGQTVFHIHMHLLGGRQMTWPPG